MINQIISHYNIIEKLGKGGMGLIYKAEDLKLKRIVAIKFLSESYSIDEETKQRFIYEAQHASALQHNNICTIHEIDETEDGEIFIVMDYYEGETLKSLINKKLLNINEILKITIQIAEGLSKAHEKGILHRDIKPSNIFITKDRTVKILDFGLAKRQDQTQYTKRDFKFGTTNYMSPEQIKGGNVDHRTDIWSLGVLLYEMLTGKPPFQAAYEQTIIYLILNEEPADVIEHRTDVPEKLLNILEKSMAKDPYQRYEDFNIILEELAQVKNNIEPKSPKFDLPAPLTSNSIAVLPFINLSTDPEQELFCDGLTEELISTLSRVKDLKVVARTSVYAFKGTSYDIRNVGRKLDVKTVLEGSVRKFGEKLRITAQLINVMDGYHLWSEKYDRELKDIFDLQDEISLTIVDKLKVKLHEHEKSRLLKRYTDNIEAYNLVQRANYFFDRFNFNIIGKTIERLKKALEMDPNYAPAYYGLASSYFAMMWFGMMPTKKGLPLMKKYTQKTLELNEDFWGGYHLLGIIKGAFEFKNDESASAFQRSLELNPNDMFTLANYGMNNISLGKFDAANKLIDRALTIDPLSDFAKLVGQYADFCKMKFEKVELQLKNYLESDPPFLWGLWFLWRTYSFLGRKEEAVQVLKKIFAEVGSVKMIEVIDRTSTDNAFKTIAYGMAQSYTTNYSSPYNIATLFAHAGIKEETLKWLKESIDVIDPKSHYLLSDPDFQILHNDERFKEYVKRVGLN